MARLPREKIQEIRQAVDIVDVVGNYIALEKSGRNYKGLCPFHEDSNPSLSVSPEKQIYHCFVCNAGGNVFDFVENYNKVSFIEAVKTVAGFANIDLSGYQLDHQAHRSAPQDPLYTLQDDALNLYSFYLFTKQGLSAKDYLNRRNMNQDVISHFNIGYAPHGNVLTKAFTEKGIDFKTMVQTGLIIESFEGRDLFEHRIIFPIHNMAGQVVAFSGRIFDDNPNVPKYINSPETKIFVKGNVLYNYHRAIKAIREKDAIVICEGFMDVIAYYKAGIENAVALMGTAFTKNHLGAIRRLTRNIILSLDGDKAGKQATIKIIEALANQDFHIRVVSLPGNRDPDEILESGGKEQLVSFITNAPSAFEFMLDYEARTTNLNNYEEKKRFLIRMAAQIKNMDNQFDRDFYIDKLAKMADVATSIVESLIGIETRPDFKPAARPLQTRLIRPAKVIDKYLQAQQGLLYYMMQNKKLAKMYESKLGFMIDKSYQLIANYILDYYSRNETLDVADFLECLPDENFQKVIIAIAQLDLPEINDSHAVEDYISLVKEKIIMERIDFLVAKMNESIDLDQKNELAIEIVNLKKEVKNGGKS